MQSIIDSPYNLAPYATRLVDEGVKSVIRYYNNKNSTQFPEKCITKAEAKALQDAGLDLAVVYEQRAGAGGHIEDFGPAMAKRDAAAALRCATAIGQPDNSAIYFAVDFDFFHASDLAILTAYFTEIDNQLGARFRIGVYGSGTVCTMLGKAGLASLFWLPKSLGWSGSKDFLASGKWTLFQASQELSPPWGTFDYDANQFNPAFADFGQFGSGAAAANDALAESLPQHPAPAVFRISATSGLKLRRGPGTEFESDGAFPNGTVVHGLREEGGWTQVDMNGDGAADGYMKTSFLTAVSGGLPIALGAASTPYDYAQAELARGVREVPGAQDNPRIVLYHSSTIGGAAHDEVSWCSSFVNFCVSQAGMVGTRSKWARSWHDEHWGQECTAAPRVGDIVVWRRKTAAEDGGHVAFFVEDLGEKIRVLGGNQSNCVCIQSYPKNGTQGSTRFELLSIRR